MLVETDYFMHERWQKLVQLDSRMSYDQVVMISGGFDPLHIGHLKYIIEASDINDGNVILVVVVNGDGFLKRKKHYNFMPEHERAEIVDHIRGVDYTVVWDDDTQFVDGALRLVQPHVFAKGGDRSDTGSMPDVEILVCEEMDIELRFGVGGTQKLNSSSELVENFKKLKDLS
jgi:D-beta-D-heptose 7-phosphate kinase/D-beta-D-heptose 1-phosphate adenosyltransferase